MIAAALRTPDGERPASPVNVATAEIGHFSEPQTERRNNSNSARSRRLRGLDGGNHGLRTIANHNSMSFALAA
jgi:hypothetical protein